MVKLKEFLAKKRSDLKKLEKEVGLLKMIDFPVRIEVYHEGFRLFSLDYGLATDFNIKKRSEYICGFSSPEGGYSTNRYETYPQFYFNLKYEDLVMPVLIQHPGFDKDARIVLRSRTVSSGWKECSDKNGNEEHPVNLEKVFNFFRGQGVNENLLYILKERVKEAKEF
jgi:hypothetical protein